MQINFSTVASGLGLVLANYKPIPTLPTSGSSLMAQGKTNSFQVQPAQNASNAHMSEWGVPSVLYVEKTANVNKFASAGRIGPGNCPIQSQPYTPKTELPEPIFAPFDSVKANVMRYRQQSGVNLGAWFALEGWMQSNLFSCSTGGKQGEYDVLDGFGQSPEGVANATAYMEKHWDTWITEADFIKMAQQGINTVRLPIGYWTVGPYFTHSSPFNAYANVYANTWRYVARAINWAAKYDIGVIVDLHGAYGSQNGQPHSGLSDGNIEWYNDYNQGLTTEVLVWLAKEVSDVTNVIGIQLLNEPQDRPSYWPWLNTAMDAMRKASPYAATVPLYFHDAFNLNKGAAFVATRQDFVVQDHHSYYVYTDADVKLSAKGHTKAITGYISDWMSKQSAIARRNLIIGEWSCALAPNSLVNSNDRAADQRSFCQSQADLYSQVAAGWTFWSWKLEGCKNNGGWCFQQAARQYLPATFDSWGLQTITSKLLAAAASSVAGEKSKVTNLLATVAALPMPSVTGLQLKVNVPDEQANDDDEEEDAETKDAIKHQYVALTPSSASASSSASSTSASPIAARVGMVIPKGSDASPAEHKASRVGMVVKSRSVGGSLAARAAAFIHEEHRLEARATAAQNAARSGYSDGFKTARFFAANVGLSRLGFAQQYMNDSWRARVAAGNVVAGNKATYTAQFKAGLLAAESAIVAAIQKSM